MSLRITKTFSNSDKKLVTFVTGGDPDIDTSENILSAIISGGADIIEIGMPFSDPMADGPTIQLSSNRAIKQNIDLDKIFLICKNIRKKNDNIPIILMGYYNVIFSYGVNRFVEECKNNGIDGLIVVDLQPEEDKDLLNALNETELDLIRLVTPTTDNKRLEKILENSSGFLYYVTITGITGQHSANINELKLSIEKINKKTNLPIVSGFGIKDEKQVSEICKICDGAVVGSSLVKIIEENLNNKSKIIKLVSEFVKKLKQGTKI
ncbi:MAG: Tryptophan synthase alpha chain [Alphaproteobacteria bacterium MarineAlpha5_Bin8]|nr:MAG: Tryptophan synthase alpha chain [Alphaproteobacteria bacterium MarineAlpha5_Bin7]PPR46346.1 MAG: Tryptophan synthase alpha chain [Alphaproteobacteria bacterium MarineAlpha5_Bin8]PPR54982.1 MAG: Tryptophan synthase alpha chain [Alphaproteobacteria bacterium MarineAlpha5_Bin6]|tara:strand:+ start:1105 stop:1899 length:795 start_codon:yes stop_codon:yes gene_type:complete